MLNWGTTSIDFYGKCIPLHYIDNSDLTDIKEILESMNEMRVGIFIWYYDFFTHLYGSNLINLLKEAL